MEQQVANPKLEHSLLASSVLGNVYVPFDEMDVLKENCAWKENYFKRLVKLTKMISPNGS